MPPGRISRLVQALGMPLIPPESAPKEKPFARTGDCFGSYPVSALTPEAKSIDQDPQAPSQQADCMHGQKSRQATRFDGV
jgi:hypothetical protein